MIVFTHNIELANTIKSYLIGKYTGFEILNLSSPYSGYISITNLTNISGIVPKEYRLDQGYYMMQEYIDSVNFDFAYVSLIENDNLMFRSLMEIMQRDYNGFLVIVLIGIDVYRDAITESLIKYIQQKYGKNCWKILDYEDISSIKMDTPYTPQGLLNLDRDLNRIEQTIMHGSVAPILNMKPIEEK